MYVRMRYTCLLTFYFTTPSFCTSARELRNSWNLEELLRSNTNTPFEKNNNQAYISHDGKTYNLTDM
jgi:hypothetical protein